MQLELLKSKIHRAQVTDAQLDYEGSLTIAADLMEKVGLYPYEKVLCSNLANGHRFETYAIPGTRGSGQIVLNGATAHLGRTGDRITIMSYTHVDAAMAKRWQPQVIVLGQDRTVVTRDDVDAVVIATPNLTHRPIALAAIAAGKHVLCEKPLALNYPDAKEMAEAADRAGVRHMTAFTYRFVPAMRYLAHLVERGDLGVPYHYRSCRLQDWGSRNLGWRQVKKMAGTGELGDMLSHRIDFAHLLIGPMRRLVANLKQLVSERGGQPSDLEDWVAILAEFQSGASGVLESSKLASGRNESWRSLDYVEINGSERSFVFTTGEWNKLQTGVAGGPGLETLAVPEEFWRWPGSPRDPGLGDPLVTFRYDQSWEFVSAIREQRPCRPSFHDGARAQAVLDAAVRSAELKAWVDLS